MYSDLLYTLVAFYVCVLEGTAFLCIKFVLGLRFKIVARKIQLHACGNNSVQKSALLGL